MLEIIVLSIWLAVGIGVLVWDAAIGFGQEFDQEEILTIACFWPIGLPLILFGCLGRWLSKLKSQRLAKIAARNEIRLKAERELKLCLKELEQEGVISNDNRTQTKRISDRP